MKDTSIAPKTHPRIDGIEETTDTLTSRAGLALFARYLDSNGLRYNRYRDAVFGCQLSRNGGLLGWSREPQGVCRPQSAHVPDCKRVCA